RDVLLQSAFEPIPEAADMGHLRVQALTCQFRRGAKSDYSCNVFGPGTPAALMSSTCELRFYNRSFLDKQCSNSLGPMNFVRRNRVQINLEGFDVDRDFPGRLHAVGMKVDIGRFGYGSNFRDGLNGSNFVVCVHDGNQDGVGPDGAANLFRIDKTLGRNANLCDFVALLFQISTCVQHRMMFDFRSDDMAVLGLLRLCNAPDREIVGFGSAAKKHDFRGFCMNEPGDLLTC